ncbi:unnamed protein product [Mytilus edulis]|uniref:Uncharacterized protein n=1 Tax=Mytilus edulis TaxID=6550 RepID=A0A8S3PY24_MYTED|nr:unnamed protein product [Mytilus edulis]
MGLCCSLGKVGSVSIEGSHQKLDRKETYNDLTTYLKECHEEADKLQKNFENNWLKRFKEIVKTIISRLKEACEDDPSFIEKQSNYKKLTNKLKTDVMTLIESRIKQIKKQPSCADVAAESSDDSETDGPSYHAKSGIDSRHSLECVSENESMYGDETVEKSNRYHKQVHAYKLLYECTLILKAARDNFSKINSKIEGTMCQAKI